MREFIEELEHNQKINMEKGLENRVDIDEKIMNNINKLDNEDINNIASDVDHDCEFDIYSEIKEIARSYVLEKVDTEDV